MKKSILYLLFSISLFLYHPSDGKGELNVSLFFAEWFFFQSEKTAVNDPEIIGPDRICNVFGSVVETFSGAGNPTTDVYSWKIFGPSNQLLFSGSGGSGFQSINYTFSINGTHRIELSVERGSTPLGSLSKLVEVIKGPTVSLLPNYSICTNQTLTLTALDPSTSNLSNYTFEWTDENNNFIGNGNELNINRTGVFSVTFYFLDSNGNRTCESQVSTNISALEDYSISSSSVQFCPDLPTTLTTTPAISGHWKYQRIGSPDIIELGFGSSLTILPNQDLPSSGEYTIHFEPENSGNSPCLFSKSIGLTYNPQPEFIIVNAQIATECNSLDGNLTIQAITPLDQVVIDGLGVSSPPLSPGQTYTFENLKSGSYSLIGMLGNCFNSYGSVVPLENPPNQLVFEITDIVGEQCTANGKTEGSFTIEFSNPPSSGFYRIINVKGTVVENDDFENVSSLVIPIAGGDYFVEIFDNQDCNVPEASTVIVPSLNQTTFDTPPTLAVCQSFDLIPTTNQDLEFTMIFPDGTQLIQDAGIPFSITQAGEHRIIGILPNQSVLCPSERVFTVDLIDPVDFEAVLVSQDCFGNRTFEADIFGRDPQTVRFQWLDESNNLVGTGQFLDLDPSITGNYSLDVQPANSLACPIPPKTFEIKEPILTVDVSIISTKLCEFGPRAILSITTTDFDEVTNIEWRRFDDLGQIEELPQFKDKTEIIADIAGIYEVSVFSIIPSINKNCELGRRRLDLDLTPQKVDFSIPSTLSICDPYDLIPESVDPLTFTLTFPDGTSQTNGWNEAFEIRAAGTYTLLGYNPDDSFPLCPDQKTFVVTTNEPVQFTPELINISCDGIYEYEATLTNYDYSDVNIFWRNQNGDLIGSDQTLIISTYGTYSLEVQPKGSIECEIEPISFEAPTPILSVDVTILQQAICPDQTTATLLLDTDYPESWTIEWWYTDINSNRTPLLNETNQKEILVTNEGTYETIIFSQFGCRMGSDLVLVLKSQDTVRPIVDETFQICPAYDIGPLINPGNFANYEWYFEDDLVSTSPVFKPDQIGTYNLVVYSSERCAYETSFVTEEECELRVMFPNSIQLDDPDRPFLIYTNYLIDELEVWIFSKWGEVIFHCLETELISEESTCHWDGYFDGQKIPPGSYAYRMNYRNIEKNISKVQMGSILIID